jgi:rod shape-determining protein MreD
MAEIGLSWAAAISVLIVLAVAVQSTLLTLTTIQGVIPQLVLVLMVSLAYLEGERVGVVAGFASGLLLDLLLPPGSIMGLTALVYTLVGYGVGSLRQFAPPDAVWVPVFTVALASAAAEVSYASLTVILGGRFVGIDLTLKIAGLVTLYNTLLTPFVFPLIRRIGERLRSEKVYRW